MSQVLYSFLSISYEYEDQAPDLFNEVTTIIHEMAVGWWHWKVRPPCTHRRNTHHEAHSEAQCENIDNSLPPQLMSKNLVICICIWLEIEFTKNIFKKNISLRWFIIISSWQSILLLLNHLIFLHLQKPFFSYLH